MGLMTPSTGVVGLAGTQRVGSCTVLAILGRRGSSPGTSNISYNGEVMSAALMRVFRELCSLQLEGDRGAKRRLRNARGGRVVERRTEVA